MTKKISLNFYLWNGKDIDVEWLHRSLLMKIISLVIMPILIIYYLVSLVIYIKIHIVKPEDDSLEQKIGTIAGYSLTIFGIIIAFIPIVLVSNGLLDAWKAMVKLYLK